VQQFKIERRSPGVNGSRFGIIDRPHGQVLQDSDDLIPLLDEGDDPHPPPALGALQGVDLVHLIDQPRPGPAAGLPLRGVVHDHGRRGLLQPHFSPFAPSGIGIMPVVADERFIMPGDMETNPMEKLDGVNHLEVPFLPLMQVRAL